MITSVVPKLPYLDKQQTIAFYVNQLGFILNADYGDYIILEYNGVEVHFFSFPGLVPAKSNFMIYLRVNEYIEGMYKMLQEKGVAIHPNGPLQDKPWRQREFALLDPNGTLLTFGQSID